MENDSLFEKKAGLNRAIGSLQLLSEATQDTCNQAKSNLSAEYAALDDQAKKLTSGYTTLPLDPKPVRVILLRMKEIRRCITALDETVGGSKYQVDTDQLEQNPQQTASALGASK